MYLKNQAKMLKGNTMSDSVDQSSYEASVEKSRLLEAEIQKNPENFRILTGDRPTGPHIGHLFGSLQNR